MGFVIHFYIIFGTNLLTGGPAQIVVFCPFRCFAEKEYQTESKRNETFGNVIFGTNVIQRTWTLRQESNQEGTRQGGAPTLPGRTLHPRGAHVAPPTYFFLLYIPTYPQTTRFGAKNLIPPPQPSVPVRSHLAASSGAPLEGASITEGFYINNIASPMMCEQFTLNLRVHSYQLDGFFSLFGSQFNVLPLSCGYLFDVIFFCGVFVETNELWVYDQFYL